MCIEDSEDMLRYSGTSVDETCLLDFARDLKQMGYFCHRSSESISIKKPSNQIEHFELIKVFQFTPERKAMSVVIKAPNGHKYVYTKGADNYMLSKAEESQNLDNLKIEIH